METLCTLIKPYKCPNCNQDTLFFYTSNNTLIDYTCTANAVHVLILARKLLRYHTPK